MQTKELSQEQPSQKSSDYVLKLRLSQVLTHEYVRLLRAFFKDVQLAHGSRAEVDD